MAVKKFTYEDEQRLIRNFKTNIRQIPWDILTIWIFSILWCASFILIDIFFEDSKVQIVPDVGWAPTMLYSQITYFPIIVLITDHKHWKNILRVVIFISLGMVVFWGFKDYYSHLGKEGYSNPYLMYGEYRPIIKIWIPTFWMTILGIGALVQRIHNR